MTAQQKLQDFKTFASRAWALTQPYFASQDKWRARGLLAAIVALNLGLVYMAVLFNDWNKLFYDALQEKNEAVFWAQLGRFSWLAFAFIIIMGTNGALTLLLRDAGAGEDFNVYSRMGLTMIYTYFQVPLAVLLLYPAFDALDDDWQDSAALLGASKRQYWRLIALPVIMPSVLGTFILLFANAMGAYASAYALMGSNYNLVTIRISSLVAGDIFLEPQLAAALSVLLVTVLIVLVVVNQMLLKRSYHAR